MRVHDGGLSELAAQPACQTLIGGLGTPGLRDLDFGRQAVRYLEHLDWPERVVVEALPYAAHLVLDRVHELRPAQVVLVAAVAREGRTSGTLHRYRLDSVPPEPEAVHQGLASATTGQADLDHTLAVVRHWGAFPADTTVIEVQPADCSFGPGFSDLLGDCIDTLVALVRDGLEGAVLAPDLDREHPGPRPPRSTPSVSDTLARVADDAREHEQRGHLEPHRNPPLLTKLGQRCPVRLHTRSRPFGVGPGMGGDWYDVIPKPGGALGIVLGDASGRGTEGAAAMAELRAAVRAYAVLDDDSPRQLLSRLDRLVGVTRLGAGSALTYVHLQPQTGQVAMSTAGPCPPLLATGDGAASFLGLGDSPLLGTNEGERPELAFVLGPEATLFLFTAGLAQAGQRSLAEGLEWVRVAAARGPRSIEGACDFVFNSCLDHRRRWDDDASVLAIGLDPRPSTPLSTGSGASATTRG